MRASATPPKETVRPAVLLRDYWRLLKRYVAPQRGSALLMTALLLVSVGLQLVGPQLLRRFIDAAKAGEGQEALIRSALLFLTLTTLYELTKVLATYSSERVAWTATNTLRADLTEHLLGLELPFFKTHPPGDLIERIDGDVNVLANFFSSFVVQLLGSFLLLVGVVVAFFLLNPLLGLAFALFSAAALFTLGWVRRFAVRHVERDREHSADFYGYLGEVIAAREDVRTSGAVPYAMQGFYRRLRAWLPVQRAAAVGSHTVWLTAVLVFACGDALAYGLGGGLYRTDALSIGAVYAVIAYTAMLAAPLETLRAQLQNLQGADASILRVQNLLSQPANLTSGAREVPSGPLSLEFRDVRFAYEDGGKTLEGLSFRVGPGRVLGVLGRTGSGKSTLARLLFRFYDPQAGSVILNGTDIRKFELASLRARVGFVTQDVQLFDATLRDNLTFFDGRVSDTQLLKVFAKLGLRAWLERQPQGLDTRVSQRSLSAGEAQLVAFARVFLRDPGLLVLDEASSRLDPATEKLLEHALDTLFRNRTVVIIAHRLATLERADDILVLDEGRVLEQGSKTALAADPTSHFSRLGALAAVPT